MPSTSLNWPIGSAQTHTDRRTGSADQKQEFCSELALVPQLVSAQAALTPQAPALVQGKVSLTYEEVDERANQLAYLLRPLGVGPDVVVGLYLDRSPAMVVGALAILKAGGAYLPLDPSYPAKRLASVLEDAQVIISLVARCSMNHLPARLRNVITLDREGRAAAAEKPELIPNARAEDLAYVIYTSGSTGSPKGVQITHQSLSNLVRWHQRAFGVNPTDRASQLASPGFDAAVWELWPYLSAGATVYFPDDLTRSEPEALRNWLVQEQITITFVPTPLAERMLLLKWPREAALRILLTGADTLHRCPPPGLPFTLVNNYGPTECTVVALSGPVFPYEHLDVLPPVGRPIDNTQIYILNEDMQQVPSGESGEICVGGAGVARGYRNCPDLTAQRFVPNPFKPASGERLYKTGDLGRYLPDGQIAFLGRIDDQVKIRGFRIEPAEIVSILDAHPDVQASVVLAREVEPGDKRLIAYIVPRSGARLIQTELRDFISVRLPEYMVPAIFVEIKALPLNPNGKIDRASLPEPNGDNVVRDDTVVQPRTIIETRLTAIVAALLGLKQVSVEDNFFQLGGHSLLGTQLIARVRDGFSVDLSLRSLFEAPTVSKLAAHIETMLLAKMDAMSEEDVHRLLDT